MPIGIMVDAGAVVLGGFAGSILGNCLRADIKQKMNWIFGICALGMGISSVILMQNMPPVVFSVITGTLLGLLLKFGSAIEAAAGKLLSLATDKTAQEQKELMLTAVVLFCASGTGIYGALDAGMTGNHNILIAKAVLDFFTAAIFACQLGKVTSLIGIPQFAVLMMLYLLAKVILPLTNDAMIRDFKACGGFLLLATGFRMMQLRSFPVADMIPSMILVMPVSYLWSQWVLPIIS